MPCIKQLEYYYHSNQLKNLANDTGLEIITSKNVFKGVTFSINVDEPVQVDLTIKQVKNIGGTIFSEPDDAFWGGRTASFADPENNVWEVAFNPDSTFDERGAMLTI
ncbi:VOC family protein [Paucisalibacillus sp. EB02]|uniref:VOC family protein n=1 Tax=Paucisalibacillus sp. EB02 TaxID=1347087 RepID=UPI0004B5E863|nr:VOC family protein [Paucisalibacillus sp. EB02]